jgi:hypothetical protein
MPRKKKSKIYFGMDVQDAIVRYNTSENDSIRNKIYQNEIHKAFDKLAENIINTFKFSYFDYGFEDVKCEVVAFLVMNIHKYDHTKGSKAFSYFSVVAKNYLILHNNNNYKKYKSHYKLDILDKEKYIDDTSKTRFKDITNDVIKYFEKNISSIFNNKKDIQISYALLEIFKNREDIENYNKKFIYLLIREMTDVKTSQITKVVKIFKQHYLKILNNYDEYTLNPPEGKFF